MVGRTNHFRNVPKADPTTTCLASQAFGPVLKTEWCFQCSESPKAGVLPLSVFGALLVSAARIILVISVSLPSGKPRGTRSERLVSGNGRLLEEASWSAGLQQF